MFDRVLCTREDWCHAGCLSTECSARGRIDILITPQSSAVFRPSALHEGRLIVIWINYVGPHAVFRQSALHEGGLIS